MSNINEIKLSDITAGDTCGLEPTNPRLKSIDLHIHLRSKAGYEVLRNRLSPNVLKRVDVLRQIQSEHDELEAKYLEERRALEDRYLKLYQPLYSKRYEIVNGVVEIDGVSKEDADIAVEEKGVPNFWLNALKANEEVAEPIMVYDEEALKYLNNITWSRIDGTNKDEAQKGNATKGFKLEFFFDPNPYFTNSVLTKTYYMVDEDEPMLQRATGTEIVWRPGKCLTEKELIRKPKKGSKRAMPVTKTEKIESFFDFFNPPEVPDSVDDISEEASEELQDIMEQDYDIGSTIRDKIIPHAVSWFTGEAATADIEGSLDDDFYDLDDDDDDDEEEYEDEDGDEEDEDDDNDKEEAEKEEDN